ncbi:phosphoglycerate dehydrogenase [Metallumcola ferriviriculae]|uniref:D-3-phosphoglycerate dehydrogenase n=1 Tax=Metallumcola ferriviriculae TaxID=3039180 RepID=A0AAU0UK61_9FIRM|nr:phosphoglycerate dehydrogenase [Desulfitibacteraceae bacterium MK1]
MRVLISDPIADKGVAMLEEAGFHVDVRTKKSEEEICGFIDEYHAMIVRSQTKVTRNIIEKARNLKIIGRAGVGIDNIDVDAATEKGIVVVNAPEGNTIAATEHTLAMMLAFARNIPKANELLKQGLWERKKFTGVELRNKVLGIIGLGKIGSGVASRARAFEMNVLAYDPYISEERAKQMGVELSDFNGVIENADFLTIHLPLTEETYHLIGGEQIKKMKPGVKIVNVARGGIIDEQALYEALKEGKIAGAAVDVFENEPETKSPLFDLENVVVTPHLGASTEEAQLNVAIDVVEEIIQALKGELVKNAVNIPSIKPELQHILNPYRELVEKLGKLISQLVDSHIKKVEIKYNGDIAQYNVTSLTNTFLKGLLRPILKDAVNYVNAPLIAQSRGISVSENKSVELDDYANLITVSVETEKCTKTISGSLFGKHDARIVRIDGFTVDAVPQGHMLVVPHIDKPKIIGPVGHLIGQHDINIAGMQVGRKNIGGRAVMFLNVDSEVPVKTIKELAKIDGVLDVKYVRL